MTWLWQRIRGAFESIVEKAFIAIILIAGLVVLGFVTDKVTLPVWALALIAALAFLVGLPRRSAFPVLPEYVAELERQLTLNGYYATFLWDALQTMQKAARGDLTGIDVDQLVELGLLAPAREFLMQAPGEDVRLSVLVPEGQDFRMKWVAGHRLVSKQNFRLRIGDSFSRFAFQTGQIESSDDVDDDPRFQPHPKAERPYSSIISVPIRSGDDIVAVFNVVSTLPYAFTQADFVFVVLVGALVDVAWALNLGKPPGLGAGSEPPAGEG